jgi:hypothetical protein
MLQAWKIIYKRKDIVDKNIMIVHAETLEKAQEAALEFLQIDDIIGIIEDNKPKTSKAMLLNETEQ